MMKEWPIDAETIKSQLAFCPLRNKFATRIVSIEAFGEEVWVCAEHRFSIGFMYVFVKEEGYYFSLCGFDRILLYDQSRDEYKQGNYNLIAKYFNKILAAETRQDALLVLYEFLINEEHKFQQFDSEYYNIKKNGTLAETKQTIISILDGYGYTKQHREILAKKFKKDIKKK